MISIYLYYYIIIINITMESEKELRDKIRPIMENMVFQLVCDKPDDAVYK